MAVRKAVVKKAAKKAVKKAAAAKKPAVVEKRIAAKKVAVGAAAAKKIAAKKLAVARKTASKKSPPQKTADKPGVNGAAPSGTTGIDLTAIPGEAIVQETRWICLACILDIYTRNFGFAQTKARAELKSFAPSVPEITSDVPMRPYFEPADDSGHCPHCGSAKRWHAPLRIIRIESGSAADAPRRALIKSLPASQGKFEVLEQKATQREAFYQWLEKIGQETDFERPGWLKFVARHYLTRKLPKEDWVTIFSQSHSVRRSRRLEEGYEIDAGRLFLAPSLFDEVLVVQYLVSRSQKAGGLTFEGRLTLHDLLRRLRAAGTLREFEVTGSDEGEVFEHLIDHLGGGEDALRFYYILDRREFLDALAAVKDAVHVPKPPATKLL